MKTTFTDTLQKHSKAVTAGAVVAVLALGGGVYTLTQGKEETKPTEAKIVTSTSISTTSSSSKVQAASEDSQKAVLEDAEKKVVILEKNQVTENISPAQTATDKVADATKKATFQKRIDAVKAAITVKEAQARDLTEAEKLVKSLENNQVSENVSPAQVATDKVADQGKKGTLQTRIDAVKNAIQVRADQAAQAAAAQAAAQAQVQTAQVSQETPASSEEPAAVASSVSETPAQTAVEPTGFNDPATAAAIAAHNANPNDPALAQAAVNAMGAAELPKDYSHINWNAGN